MPDCTTPLVSPGATVPFRFDRVIDYSTGELQYCAAPTGREEDGGRAVLQGLSNSHITTREHNATLTYWQGAGLVKVVKGGFRSTLLHDPPGRGEVTTMSRAARRRLMYRLGMIRREVVPLFVTLTYPGLYTGDAKTCKLNLEALRKRFERAGVASVWRLEYKTRRSGASKGEAVPHFHMLVWCPGGLPLEDFRPWVSKVWYEVVGSGQTSHLEAGTSCEVMRSWRGVMWYAAKYISKEDLSRLPAGVGRLWGVINESLIPWALERVINITDAQCYKAIKAFEAVVSYEIRESCPSMTMLVDSSEVWRDKVLQM